MSSGNSEKVGKAIHLYKYQQQRLNKGTCITTMTVAAILILLIFTIAANSSVNLNGREAGIVTAAYALQQQQQHQLQFPKSQKLDLMAINSGNPPSTG